LPTLEQIFIFYDYDRVQNPLLATLWKPEFSFLYIYRIKNSCQHTQRIFKYYYIQSCFWKLLVKWT
jgi:hypothetical protein